MDSVTDLDCDHRFAWPDYARPTLGSVLPSVLASLTDPGSTNGAPGADQVAPLLDLPATDRAVVVLVDGLGDRLLRRRAGHAPFLRSLLSGGRTLQSGFPTTTASAMGTFGTGLPPGAHGLVGYEVRVPGTDRILNELSWEDGPVPEEWQPHTTVFERARQLGIRTALIGPGFFDGSGLTRATLRGGSFVAAADLSARVDAALACAATARSLTYIYWGEVDKTGHVHGCESWQWGDELAATDAELDRLAHSLPAGTALHVTADHGMVDVPDDGMLDAALDPLLRDGVARIAGEPRSPQVYAVAGAVDDVLTRWRERLGARGTVLSREQAVDAGLFGEVREEVLPRIGDVVALMAPGHSVVDSRVHRPELIALRGVHGSITADEMDIPLLSVTL